MILKKLKKGRVSLLLAGVSLLLVMYGRELYMSREARSNVLSRADFVKEIMLKRVDLSLTVEHFNEEEANIFHLNPRELCLGGDESLLFVAFVVISPDAFGKRSMIRATWANATLFSSRLRVFFALGKSQDEQVNEQIKAEFERHRDVLQLNFIDSYSRITRKVMLSFRWIASHCSLVARYVLRTNEDVIVNSFALLDLFSPQRMAYEPRQIYGWLVKNYTTHVDRKRSGKFYVSYEEYALPQYPDYPSGKLIVVD